MSWKKFLNPKNWFDGEVERAEQMALGAGAFLFVLSILFYFRANPHRAQLFSVLAVSIAGLGIIYPRALIPLERTLRAVIFAISWLNTKLMLILVFYLVFTPMAFLLKLMGKKLLETEIDPSRESYFEPREEEEYKPEKDELQF